MFKRKMTALFLALAMCLSLSMANAFATESSLETSHPEIDFNGPMVFYPFVYTEEAGWAWARELIGDCSSCVPGYLYLQDLTTKEITQIIEDPVDMFCPDREILYCIVNGNSVVKRTIGEKIKPCCTRLNMGILPIWNIGQTAFFFQMGNM